MTTKPPNIAAITLAPRKTSTLPAAPVDATRDAGVEPELPPLSSAPSATGLVVKVGTVLTIDLLMLILSVVAADPVDDTEDKAPVPVVSPAADFAEAEPMELGEAVP